MQGYNGIVGPPPFNRTELFEAWYEQEMIKDVLKIRIGRVNPGADFNNVLRPVTFTDSNQNIPSVSGLIYSTIFANGTLIGVLPGYYNSGNGVTINFTPTKSFYLNLGVYDGKQRPPHTDRHRSRPRSTATTSTSARSAPTGRSARAIIPGSSASASGARPASSPRRGVTRMAPAASTCSAPSASPTA